MSPLTLLLVAAIIFTGLTGCDQAPLPKAERPGKAVTQESSPSVSLEVDDRRFAQIEVAAQEEIDAGHIPGAVVLVGHRGRIIYRKAFGQRCLEPQPQPMTVDTIFDIASLTKVVAPPQQSCSYGIAAFSG